MASLMQAQQSIRRTNSKNLGIVVPTSATREYAPASLGGGGAAADPRAGAGGGPRNNCQGFIAILRGQVVLACMIVFIPLGIAAHFLEWDPAIIFTLNFLAIIPLAWLIGKSTEDLAASVGQTLGGLLNATFGNVVEMLLCVSGIKNNQIIVVQCTLLGSILSNLLLVLGTAFLVGGIFFYNADLLTAGCCYAVFIDGDGCVCNRVTNTIREYTWGSRFRMGPRSASIQIFINYFALHILRIPLFPAWHAPGPLRGRRRCRGGGAAGPEPVWGSLLIGFVHSRA